MSKLEELIKEYCPHGVEFKDIGSFCEIKTGKGITNKDTIEDGKYPVISGGVEPMGYINLYNRNANTVTIARAGSAGFVNYINTYFYLNDKCFSVIPIDTTLSKYLFYALKNIEQEIISLKSNGSVPTVNTEKVSSIVIPVPPIEVQREIVRILDNFTELTAELTARKKQYEYYRDQLLNFEKIGGVERVRLGDIATDIFRGSGIKREEVTEDGIPCVRYGEIYTRYNTWFEKCISHTKLEYVASPKFFEHGDILFAITGESVEDIAKSVAYVGHEKCLAGGDIVVMKHKQNPRYVAHALLTTDARAQKSKGKVKSKVVHASVQSIEDIEIPLPSLDVQERIANVLDNFDAICSDLNIGLPAEIEARNKQYAYYRDLLLSFDRSQFGNVERERERAGARRSDEIKLLQYVFGYAAVRVKEVYRRLRGTPITAGKMKEIENESGEIRVFAGGKTVINTKEADIPNANITRVPAVLVQSRGVIDAVYYDKPFTFKNEMWAYTHENQITVKYLFYVLKNDIDHFREAASGMGSLPQISLPVTEEYVFLLPSCDEQKRIVETLDRFEVLCNDITEGLPAEIEVRQKQYEYYRDRLLSFKEC